MSTVARNDQLTVPQSLQSSLEQFKRRVWTTKMLEVVSLAVAALFATFLILFVLDRFVDTDVSVRWFALGATLSIFALIPVAFHRWVWCHRRLEQLAKLLRRRDPVIGDQLLGVIELAENCSEQARSRTLCAAAMQQVAEAASKKNLLASSPPTKHRGFASFAVLTCTLSLIALAVVPSAAINTWGRFLTPWREVPRFTFASLSNLPDQLIVPHGEPYAWKLQLAADSRWRPDEANVYFEIQSPSNAKLTPEGSYVLALPAMTYSQTLDLRVGDVRKKVRIEPLPRPELMTVNASIRLPSYLEIDALQERDARSGSITVVAGSTVEITANASRTLQSAMVSGSDVEVDAARFVSPAIAVEDSDIQVPLEWTDLHGLQGSEAFLLQVRSRSDDAPSVSVEGLARQAVVLNSEQLNFSIFAGDDFGIKRVGISWKGLDDRLVLQLANGEKVLAAGGPEQAAMQVQAAFVAADVGVEPQPIEVRAWVEDYYPDRERQYSASYIMYVLSPDQHAIWITEQLSKWHRQSLDVRDREMQLHEANKQLRDLLEDALSGSEMQKRLEEQAAAEGANGRRLTQLTRAGEELVRQAARNPEIGVAHLDKWADMLQILKDISGNRMPSVEDLLKKAAVTAKSGENQSKSQTGPAAGKIRDLASNNNGGSSKPTDQPKPPIPSIVDRESSQQPLDANGETDPKASKSKHGRLTLPTTTLAGPPQKAPQKQDEDEDQAPIDDAIREQADLLAEFEKIVDELNQVLANLEGSTLVKRLKAASREQSLVASKLSDQIDATFGKSIKVDPKVRETLSELAKSETKSVQTISHIMDDLSAYFARRRANKFKLVLDEMKEFDVLAGIRAISDDIPKEQGMSIAQCEFWSDTLDRWADDLVDPACKGSCTGGKSRDSLPPSIILELLQILEAEVNLREETRVVEQAKSAQSDDEYAKDADKLAEKQEQLQVRIQKVLGRIRELPEFEVHFTQEIQILEAVDSVMGEAVAILASPDTGPAAIAAETEAIELLLQSKRINPNGGGGGGSSPGGGMKKGTTTDSALALVGKGVNEQEHREHRAPHQATGESGNRLPEEFRSGLDEYFNRLDSETK